MRQRSWRMIPKRLGRTAELEYRNLVDGSVIQTLSRVLRNGEAVGNHVFWGANIPLRKGFSVRQAALVAAVAARLLRI